MGRVTSRSASRDCAKRTAAAKKAHAINVRIKRGDKASRLMKFVSYAALVLLRFD
jgi:hypothetical protein